MPARKHAGSDELTKLLALFGPDETAVLKKYATWWADVGDEWAEPPEQEPEWIGTPGFEDWTFQRMAATLRRLERWGVLEHRTKTCYQPTPLGLALMRMLLADASAQAGQTKRKPGQRGPVRDRAFDVADGTYTDVKLLDLRGAIERLPDILTPPASECAHGMKQRVVSRE